MTDLSILEKNINVVFKNRDFLLEALTHRSYLNENPRWKVNHNERFEFLGDAVLELIITELLFFKYPQYDEGKLTSFRASLVNYLILSRIARSLGLENFLLLSAGEAKDIGRARDVILANAFESLVGAIYLDQGYATVVTFLEKFVFSNIEEVVRSGAYRDPKSSLQEVVQEKLKITPVYQVLEERGPDHRRVFRVGVFFGDRLIAEGEGLSKQEAEAAAAEKALGATKYEFITNMRKTS